jgi:hypothetical protein
MENAHTGANLAHKLLECVQTYGIEGKVCPLGDYR